MTDFIHFTHEDFDRLRDTYDKWWAGTLKRPVASIITHGHPTKKETGKPPLHPSTAWDTSIPVTDYLEHHEAYLDTLRFHGDAFPFFNTMGFGPGVVAAFMGCTPISSPSTVWFRSPDEDIPIEELHFEYNPENPHFRRVVNLYEAAMERWDGKCVIGMVDLGGVLDILASFRGTENLLYDLYDSPEEVKRCVKEIQTAWFRYHDAINDIMRGTEGYSHWFGLYSAKPSYILQSDFSYMLGSDMFEDFIGWELASSAERLSNALYHMDGIGQIVHLENLLKIDSIKAIQWVPGDGEPSQRNWDELLAKILASGKKLIYWNQNPDGSSIKLAKDAGQLYHGPRYFHTNDIEAAKRYAAMHGITISEKE